MKFVGHDFGFSLLRPALITLLVSILPGFVPPLAALEGIPHYSSRIWQVDEGLPDNVVQAITQTPDGYLWVGTRSGLARFDGVSFTPFEAKPMPELGNASITDLHVDRKGA